MPDKTEYQSTTTCLSTGCGNLFVTLLYSEDNKLKTTLTHFGKSGVCAETLLTRLRETINVLIQHGSISLLDKVLAAGGGNNCQYGHKCCAELYARLVEAEIRKGG